MYDVKKHRIVDAWQVVKTRDGKLTKEEAERVCKIKNAPNGSPAKSIAFDLTRGLHSK